MRVDAQAFTKASAAIELEQSVQQVPEHSANKTAAACSAAGPEEGRAVVNRPQV
jgi:hypothetical protein